ncbi:MAG: hypothetical protein AVDCRST_MAG86-356 [uncultured Truepera sp.]|uniref:Uncharacterized protein n=1 Tax=uncultured Truepera sp. TaxID=543023 RepID=A0A6J4UQV6_9DEIN|nr:MAG: hypothetical protein AVDCRST_MAG86-356 [uncultured Truepera sp.]
MTKLLRGFTGAERVKNLAERSVSRASPGGVYKVAVVTAEAWADEPMTPPGVAARAGEVVMRHFVRKGRSGRLYAFGKTQSASLGEDVAAGLRQLTTRDG